MSALTAARATHSKALGAKHSLPMAASSTVYAGSMVMLDGGYAKAGADSATGVGVFGIALSTVDNSAGSAGDLSVIVQEGRYLMATGAITQADVGAIAYVSDDATAETTTANSMKAGIVVAVESATEAWISMGSGV